MKKLLFLILLIPVLSYTQEESTINLNVREGVINDTGFKYIGNGQYTLKKRKAYSNQKKMTANARVEMINYAKSLNANYRTINVEYTKWEKGRLIGNLKMTFELRDKITGALLINKDEAKKELLSLKEYLDLGIITQEEFDKKAESYKKIILK